jgi:DNA primase
MFSETVLQDLRSKADIVEIIQRYIPLVKKGKNFFGLCPFHDDHDPSLSISPDKQIYKCFVCGAGGNVFNFVKDHEKITYSEAIVKVAAMVSYPLEYNQNPSIDPKIQSYYDVLNEYVKYVRYTLNTTAAQQAKSYLIKRGLTEATLQKFEIGYNPSEDAATSFLLAKNYPLDQTVRVNVTRSNEYGNKDVFSQRIIFPIHSPQGQVVGFTARSINPNESSKYINTTETPIYVKGRLLFNYHRALKAIKEQQSVVLVEGVMDTIALDQVGIHNVVATLGTACTKDQMRLLQQATNHVIMCYDADEAGQTAMFKLGKLLQSQRFKVSVLLNQSQQDLDEMALVSTQKLIDFVQKPIHFVEFLFEYHVKRMNLNNYSERKAFASLLMQEVSALSDQFDQAMLIERVAQVTQFSPDQLKLLNKPPVNTPARTAFPQDRKKQNPLKDWPEKEILSQMLISKQAMLDFRKSLGYLSDPKYQSLALQIMHHYRQHEQLVIADFMNDLEDDAQRALVSELVNSDIYFRPYAPDALQDAFIQVKINTLDAEIFAFKQAHKEDLSLGKDISLLEAYQTLLNRRQDLIQLKGKQHHDQSHQNTTRT